MKTFWRTSFRQRNLIYLLCHIVMVLVGIVLVQRSGELNVAIGTSMVATGIAGWTLFAYILVTDRWTSRLEVLARFGFVDAYPARSARIKEIYDEKLRDARTSIDLLGYGQSSFREDFAAKFDEWVARGVIVRILLIDPEFPSPQHSLADQRDFEEGNPTGSVGRDVQAFLARTEALRSKAPDQFRVRLYRCLPSVNVFRIDDEVFWGPYLMGEQSRNSPTFLVGRSGLLFERFSQHFDEIWRNDDLSRVP